MKIGSPSVEPLIDALNKIDKNNRFVIVLALGEIKDPRAASPLITLLLSADDYSSLRLIANAVGSLGKPAVAPLMAALSELKPRKVLSTHELILATERGYLLAVPREGIEAALVQVGDPAVEPLVKALSEQNENTRISVAKVLGEIGSSKAIKALTERLKDEKDSVRKAASEALEKIQGANPKRSEARLTPAQEKQFQKAMSDLQPKWYDGMFVKSAISRRLSAIKMLGEFKDPRVFSYLGIALHDAGTNIRIAAVSELVKIQDPRVILTLNPVLQDTDYSVRAAAVSALRGLNAVSEIAGELSSKFADIRLAAVGALSDLKSSPELAKALDDTDNLVRGAAITALRGLKSDAILAKGRNSKYVDVRLAAVAALREMMDISELARALRDTDLDIRLAVVGALRDLRAIPQLAGVLNDSDYSVRGATITSLQNLNALSELGKELNNKYPDVRISAAMALGELKDTDSVAALMLALKDERAVSDSVAVALEKIGDPRSISALSVYKDMRAREEEAARIARESELSSQTDSNSSDDDYGPQGTNWNSISGGNFHSFIPLPLLALAGNGGSSSIISQLQTVWDKHAVAVVVGTGILLSVIGALAVMKYLRHSRSKAVDQQRLANPILDRIMTKATGISLEEALALVPDAESLLKTASDFDVVYVDGTPGEDPGMNDSMFLSGRVGANAQNTYSETIMGSSGHWTIERPKNARSEVRLTPAEEKQFQKAMSDLQAKWRDGWFNSNGVPRRIAAVKVLGSFQDPRVVSALGIALHDSDKDVRIAAVSEFGRSKDPRAAVTMSVGLRDSNGDVRKATLTVLLQMKAFSDLGKELNNHYPEVRLAAVRALRELKSIPELVMALNDVATAVRGLAVSTLRDLKAFPELSKEVNNKYPDVRVAARTLLQELGALTEIGKGLGSQYLDARLAAVSALRELKSIPEIVRALSDEDAAVRAAAIAVLRELNALSELGKELSNKYPDVRIAAATSLGDLKDSGAVSALIEALKDRTISDAVASALNKINDPRSDSALSAYKEILAREAKERAERLEREREEAERLARESEASSSSDGDYPVDNRNGHYGGPYSFIPLPLLALAGNGGSSSIISQLQTVWDKHAVAVVVGTGILLSLIGIATAKYIKHARNIAELRRQNPILDLIMKKTPKISLKEALQLVANAKSTFDAKGDFEVVFHQAIKEYQRSVGEPKQERLSNGGSFESYDTVTEPGSPAYWTIELPKSARSEVRIGSWMSFGLAGVMMFFAGIKASLAGAFGVPTAPTKVYTQAGDRRIFVQERSQDGTLGQPYAFTLKGVNWGPSSVGMDPATNPTGYRQQMFSWSTNDIALMSKMGINIVRPYYDFGTNAAALALLDQFYQYGIKVIMPVDSPYYGQIARSNNIPGVVNTFKNHPAIFGWGIGNEWDLNYYYNTFTNLQTSVVYTEKAAQIVRNLDTNHVIATFLADPHIPYRADYAGNPLPYHYAPETLFDPGTSSYTYTSVILSNLPSIHVFGWQIYRGGSFGDAFSQIAKADSRPGFVSEFGADAYSHLNAAEDQTMQANFNRGLWDEIVFSLAAERTNGVVSGGLVFEWNDEWSKNGYPTTHDISNEANGGQPDNVNDEEWFGITDIYRNPRLVYTNLQQRYSFDGQTAIQLVTNPVMSVTSGTSVTFSLNGKTILSRAGYGAGARGLNILILDEKTGARIKEFKHLDTYAFKDSAAQMQTVADYLNSIPNGSIVMIGVADNSGLFGYGLDEPVYRALEALGSTQIRTAPATSWAMITKKGTGKLAETSGTSAITATSVLTALDPNATRRQALAPVANPVIRGLKLPSGNFQLKPQLSSNLVYQVEYRDDLKTGSWKLARRGIVSEGPSSVWIDDGSFTGGTLPVKRFYRVAVIDRAARSEARTYQIYAKPALPRSPSTDASSLAAKLGTALRVAANTVSPLLSVSPVYAAEIEPVLFAGTTHYQRAPGASPAFSEKWRGLTRIIRHSQTAQNGLMAIDQRHGIPNAPSVLPSLAVARANPKAIMVLALIAGAGEVSAFEKELVALDGKGPLPANFIIQSFRDESGFVAAFGDLYKRYHGGANSMPIALVTDREVSSVTDRIGSYRQLLTVVGDERNPIKQTAAVLLAADKLLDEAIWSMGYHFVSVEKLGGWEALMAEVTNFAAAQAKVRASA